MRIRSNVAAALRSLLLARRRSLWQQPKPKSGGTLTYVIPADAPPVEEIFANTRLRRHEVGSLVRTDSPAEGAVQAVDVRLVLKALEPIWQTKPETASRLRRRIESVLNWAAVREYRKRDNPARWRGHLDKLLPARSRVQRVEHHPALPYDQLADFVAMLRSQEGIAARALEFLILTATRTGEVIGGRWDEIDLGEKIWVVPAARMKAGREHRSRSLERLWPSSRR